MKLLADPVVVCYTYVNYLTTFRSGREDHAVCDEELQAEAGEGKDKVTKSCQDNEKARQKG